MSTKYRGFSPQLFFPNIAQSHRTKFDVTKRNVLIRNCSCHWNRGGQCTPWQDPSQNLLSTNQLRYLKFVTKFYMLFLLHFSQKLYLWPLQWCKHQLLHGPKYNMANIFRVSYILPPYFTRFLRNEENIGHGVRDKHVITSLLLK